MQNNNKTVIGSYDSRDEALDVVHKLKNEGYQKQDIILYGNDDAANSIGDHEGVNVTADPTSDTDHDRSGTTTNDTDDSLWDQIKGAFSTDTYDNEERAQSPGYSEENDVLYPYREDIKNGKIVVAVDNFRGENIDKYNSVKPADHDPARDAAPDRTDIRGTDKNNDSIQLKEEKMDVDKKEVTTGEVDVRKEVVRDTETVEVPVEKEEIVIERKPVSENDPNAPADSIDETGETINIPVKEEQIEVSKHPVVKEEVDVHKEQHKETKQVTEEVAHEELDVETKGNAKVDDTPDDKDPMKKPEDRTPPKDDRGLDL